MNIMSDCCQWFEKLDKVCNVYAVDRNTEEAVKEISECEIMATAVGVKYCLI